jgi:probable HAF family extracellular repeat protein
VPATKLLVLAALAAAIGFAQTAAAGPQQYKLTPFAFPTGHGWITLSAVNNSGQATGTFSGTLAHDSNLAGYWNIPSNSSFLPGFGHGTRGANGINNNGIACGFANTSANAQSAAGIYWENGQTNLLRPLSGGDFAICNAINDSGLAVGQSDLSGNATHATEWSGYNVIDLGALGSKSNSSYALAINNSGLVVGYTDLPNFDSHPTVWTNHVPKDLGTLGGPDGQAEAVNDSGQIVGYSSIIAPDQPDGWQIRPFLWQNGTMTLLPVLGDGSNGFSGEAKGISASGIIVGQANVSVNPGDDVHGVMWKNGAIIDLNDELRAYLPKNTDVMDAPAISANGRFLVDTWTNNNETWYEVLPLVATQVNLTATPDPDFLGQTVMMRAFVGTGASPAVSVSGTVTFKDGTKVLGSSQINLQGLATFSTSSLAIGTHPLTATYAGEGDYAPGTSQVVNEVVRYQLLPAP